MRLRVRKIAEIPVEREQEAIPFTYVPKKKDERLKGLLFTSGVELSLSFKNGADFKLNQYQFFHTPSFAPDERIIKLDEPIQGIIKGLVYAPLNARLFATGGASIYFIIQEKEQ